MSDSAVPSWKQELLKRKQGKLTHEKLILAQKVKDRESSSKSRSVFANSNTSLLNNRFADTETKERSQVGQQRGHNKNYDVYGHNSRNVFEAPVDMAATRHTSGNSHVLSGPSRLEGFEKSEEQTTKNAGKYSKSFSTSGRTEVHGMSQNTRGHEKEEITNERDRLNSSCQDRVDTEHIRLQDIKKMWQKQAIKDEPSLKSPTYSKNPAKGFSTGPPPAFENPPNHVNPPVNSPTFVPKAYRSPYAKAQWSRPGLVSNEKSSKGNTVLFDRNETVKLHTEKSGSPLEQNDVKSCKVKTPVSNGSAENNPVEDEQVEHIQSVKSLLGLFGGKARPGMSRKISDNVSLGNKTQMNSMDYSTSEVKTFASKRPGLFKHHSEPNLFHPAENIIANNSLAGIKKSPTHEITAKKSPTSEAPVDEVAQLSHHVSRGIQQRMSRLRRASHSTMEDMDGFIEFDQNSNDPEIAWKGQELPSVQSQKETVSRKSSVENDKHATVGKHQQDLHNIAKGKTMQNDHEKPELSCSVNSNNKISSPVTNALNLRDKSNEIKSENHENRPEQTEQLFDNQLLLFGSRIMKKQDTAAEVNDTSRHKSENKYHNEQDNYIIESNQSHFGLHNHIVSTELSNGINLDKQELKTVIKNEENIRETQQKLEEKPRRKGLNVVDPLAVLQLTKDPILLKEKPVASVLGLLQESQSGRKPKVEIIKHEPDKKSKIAQINRAWDLDNAQKQNDHKTMPASSIHASPPHIPVTSIDEVPVSVIDDKSEVQPKSLNEVKVGNATFYNGLSSESVKLETESAESDEEFIPVSSIDAEDLRPPPEIVFDKMPVNLKSCFARNGLQKQGKISFFEHVFIHDYQSETAATSDWDFENGTSFSSYTPAAVKHFEDKPYSAKPLPSSQSPPIPPEEPRYDEPVITYNEDESIDFTGSSDSTAGALLF